MRLISKKDHLASKKSNCVVVCCCNKCITEKASSAAAFFRSFLFCAMPHYTYYQSLTTFIGHVFDRVTPRNLINWMNRASVATGLHFSLLSTVSNTILLPLGLENAELTPKEFPFQFSWWKKMQPNFMHGSAHLLLRETPFLLLLIKNSRHFLVP